MSRKMIGGKMPYVSRKEALRRKAQRAARWSSVQSNRQFVPRSVGPFAVTERKYFDTFLSSGTIGQGTSWAGSEVDPVTLNTLFCPTEGSAINNRVGRRAPIRSIKIRGDIIPSTIDNITGASTSPMIRMILYQDMQTNGVQAQGEELMSAPGAVPSVPS